MGKGVNVFATFHGKLVGFSWSTASLLCSILGKKSGSQGFLEETWDMGFSVRAPPSLDFPQRDFTCTGNLEEPQLSSVRNGSITPQKSWWSRSMPGVVQEPTMNGNMEDIADHQSTVPLHTACQYS